MQRLVSETLRCSSESLERHSEPAILASRDSSSEHTVSCQPETFLSHLSLVSLSFLSQWVSLMPFSFSFERSSFAAGRGRDAGAARATADPE